MTWETWISAASAVVALAALGLAVVEGRANRQHNRLSVAPKLRVDFVAHPENRCVNITLVNAGLGPAILDCYQPMLDRQPAAASTHSDLVEVARAAGIQGKMRYSTIAKGEVLPQGCALELLCVVPQAFDEFPEQDYDNAFRRIGVSVRFHSMYGESQDCEWHGDQFLGNGDAPDPPAGNAAVPDVTLLAHG